VAFACNRFFTILRPVRDADAVVSRGAPRGQARNCRTAVEQTLAQLESAISADQVAVFLALR
jgi:hypothetical protein